MIPYSTTHNNNNVTSYNTMRGVTEIRAYEFDKSSQVRNKKWGWKQALVPNASNEALRSALCLRRLGLPCHCSLVTITSDTEPAGKTRREGPTVHFTGTAVTVAILQRGERVHEATIAPPAVRLMTWDEIAVTTCIDWERIYIIVTGLFRVVRIFPCACLCSKRTHKVCFVDNI